MEEQNGALLVLMRAIQNEIAGQRFYEDAARHCIDPWAKELLATLSHEEEGHTLLLLGQYDALLSGVGWLDVQEAQARGAETDLRLLTFPAEEHATAMALERGADELSALALGIQMEKLAVGLYQEKRDTAGDEAARAAFRFLMEEERRHYEQLTAHWERLSGVRWEEG
jgi:rubrerythrin